MDYKSFVKEKMAMMKSSRMTQPEKMKKIGQLWRKHKQLKGGVLDDATPDSTTTPTPDKQDTNSTDTTTDDSKQQQSKPPAIEPLIPVDVALDNGIPPIITIHPNIYSRNALTYFLFTNLEDYLDSDFYKKYTSRITKVKQIKFNTSVREREIPFKKFRIAFAQNTFTDKTQWYIDPTDADEYLQMLLQLKDEDKVFTPLEFVSAKFIAQMGQKRKDIAMQDLYALAIRKDDEIAKIQKDNEAELAKQAELAEAKQSSAYYQGKQEGTIEGVQSVPQQQSSSGGDDSFLGALGTVGSTLLSFF
jgi:hypothetical protein